MLLIEFSSIAQITFERSSWELNLQFNSFFNCIPNPIGLFVCSAIFPESKLEFLSFSQKPVKLFFLSQVFDFDLEQSEKNAAYQIGNSVEVAINS